MTHRAGEWGHVWRSVNDRRRESAEDPREYADAFIRQVDRRGTGVGFEIWRYDPDAEDSRDPRALVASIEGADAHWDGGGLHLSGWVEGENGRHEDWGQAWHRERWAWHPEDGTASLRRVRDYITGSTNPDLSGVLAIVQREIAGTTDPDDGSSVGFGDWKAGEPRLAHTTSED